MNDCKLLYFPTYHNYSFCCSSILYPPSAPSGHTLPARLNHHSNNTSQISFTPLEVGVHRIHVTVADNPVSGSPFTCSVYDPSACRITDVDKTAKREREIGFTSMSLVIDFKRVILPDCIVIIIDHPFLWFENNGFFYSRKVIYVCYTFFFSFFFYMCRRGGQG